MCAPRSLLSKASRGCCVYEGEGPEAGKSRGLAWKCLRGNVGTRRRKRLDSPLLAAFLPDILGRQRGRSQLRPLSARAAACCFAKSSSSKTPGLAARRAQEWNGRAKERGPRQKRRGGVGGGDRSIAFLSLPPRVWILPTEPLPAPIARAYHVRLEVGFPGQLPSRVIPPRGAPLRCPPFILMVSFFLRPPPPLSPLAS